MATLEGLRSLADRSNQLQDEISGFSIEKLRASIPTQQLRAPVRKQIESSRSGPATDMARLAAIVGKAPTQMRGATLGEMFSASAIATENPLVQAAAQAKLSSSWKDSQIIKGLAKAGSWTVTPFKAAMTGLERIGQIAQGTISFYGGALTAVATAGVRSVLDPNASFASEWRKDFQTSTNLAEKMLVKGQWLSEAVTEQNRGTSSPLGQSLARVTSNPLAGFAMDILLDPTTFINPASKASLITRTGSKLNLTEAGLKFYKNLTVETIQSTARRAGIEVSALSVEKKVAIQQRAIAQMDELYKNGKSQELFSKGGAVFGGGALSLYVPGSAELTAAVRSSAVGFTSLLADMPGIKQLKDLIGSKFVVGYENIQKFGSKKAAELENLRVMENGLPAAKKEEYSSIFESRLRQNPYFDPKKFQFSSVGEGVSVVANRLASRKAIEGIISFEEEYLIAASQFIPEAMNLLRPHAKAWAEARRAEFLASRKALVGLGIPDELFPVQDYFAIQYKAGRGKLGAGVKDMDGVKQALTRLEAMAAAGTATKQQIAAIDDLKAILSGKNAEVPQFLVPRSFSDIETAKAAGYRVEPMWASAAWRVSQSDIFIEKRRLALELFEEGAEILAEKTARGMDAEAAATIVKKSEKVAADWMKTIDYTDPLTGKTHEIPRSYQEILNTLNRNLQPGSYAQETSSKLLGTYDRITNFYKIWLTVVHPAFWTRNFTSEVFNGILGQGMWATLRPSSYGDAWALAKGTVDQATLSRVINVGGVDYSIADLRRYMRKQDILRGQIQSEVPVMFRGMFERAVGMTESWPRAMTFLYALESTGDLRHATTLTKKIHYDYSRLTDFEKDFMKRMIPFYTFERRNVSFHFRNIVQRPQAYMNVQKAYDAAWNYVEEQNSEVANVYLPKWIKRGFFIPLPLGRDDRDRLTFVSELGLTFEAMNNVVSFDPQTSFDAVMHRLNPIIKMPVEVSFGYSIFTGRDYRPQDARSQLLMIQLMNKVAPNIVQYREATDVDGNPVYIASPRAIALVASLPTSRWTQTISTFMRNDKSFGEAAIKTLTGFGVQRVNPELQFFYDYLEELKGLRTLYENIGAIRKSSSDSFYVDRNTKFSDDPQEQARIIYEANLILKEIRNARNVAVPEELVGR